MINTRDIPEALKKLDRKKTNQMTPIQILGIVLGTLAGLGLLLAIISPDTFYGLVRPTRDIVPRAAGTEMAPESTWNPAVPSPLMQKPEIGMILNVSVTTSNGTRQYSVVEDASVAWNEGTLTVGPCETGSGNLGFGLVTRSGDGKPFLCVTDMSAREKSTRGTIRLFSQSEGGNPNIICLFTPN